MRDETEADIEAVNDRVQRFQRTGAPRWLWPTIDEPTRLSALASIERTVVAVLGGSATAALAESNAEAIGVAAVTSGTGPLLGLWAERGQIAVTPDVGEVLARHLAHARARAGRLEGGLASALTMFESRGITATVLKGFYTARQYYPDPGARTMNDIDLLIEPGQIAEAERALTAGGWIGGDIQRSPYKRDWHPPGVDRRVRALALSHAWDPWRLELHGSLDRIFAPGRIARLPHDAAQDQAWTVAGHAVRVLPPPLLVGHLAAHASEEMHTTRLMRLVELVLVIRAGVDWPRVASILRAAGAAQFVYPAFALVDRLAPFTVEPSVLKQCREAASPRVRAFVDAQSVSDRVRLVDVSLREKFVWSRGLIDVARRAGLMLWPKTSGSLATMLRTYARRVYRLTHRQ